MVFEVKPVESLYVFNAVKVEGSTDEPMNPDVDGDPVETAL